MTETKKEAKSFSIVLHPAAFSVLPLVKVWETCMGNYMLVQYLEMFALLAGVSLFIFLILRVVLKNSDKAGLGASLVFGALYFWIPFKDSILHIPSFSKVDELVIALIYLFLFCYVSAVFLAKYADKLPLRKVTLFLNVLSWAVVLSAVIPDLIQENQLEQEATKTVQMVRNEFKDVKLDASKDKPDIYYILVDGYPNEQTLKDYFNYESELIKHLRKKGFFIADHSISNHDRTEHSLTSSLNMRYTWDVKSTPLLLKIMQNNEVAFLLRSIGYKYVNASSAWEPTNYIPYADLNCATGFCNNFNVTLSRLTLISAFEERLHLMANLFRQARLRVYENREQIKAIPGPKFVLVHTLMFHPPFFLDENGQVTRLAPEMMNQDFPEPKEFLAQYRYGEKKVIEFVDTLLSDPNYKPIIIIQSDHGSQTSEVAYDSNWANERMRILSAFYLCPPVTERPPSDITPVNIFRWIFDKYFDAKLPMLPTDSFLSVPFGSPNDKRVNEYITFPGQEKKTDQEKKPGTILEPSH
ncbi:MAG: hypothetical protein K2W95_17345 [Candidatus Obscuribacterales bacterium]|nr:hypothetical protein [Candidatus Obscuribacterales bacterium]